MSSLFDRKRWAFEAIVAMAEQEHGIERISTGFVRLNGNLIPTVSEQRNAISEARIRIYRELFRNIGDPDGIGLSADGVYFYIYNEGITGSGVSKGILWSREKPGRVVGSLDHFAKSPEKAEGAWRQLATDWYLEYQNN